MRRAEGEREDLTYKDCLSSVKEMRNSLPPQLVPVKQSLVILISHRYQDPAVILDLHI